MNGMLFAALCVYGAFAVICMKITFQSIVRKGK